jgi:hypothetical protein
MPSVTRYIKIAEHPIINDKEYHQHLPSSVYSLYEISAIEPKQMLRMIKAGSVYTEMGRSEISALKQTPTPKIIQSDKIDLLHIKIPKNLLQGDYFSILNEVTKFLESKGIDFEYGKEIAKADAEEQKIHRRIEKFVFNKAKIYFDQSIKKVIEQKGRESNLWKISSRLSLKVKAQKVGYHFDEVSTSEVSSIEDLTAMYRVVEWEDEMSWENRIANWYADGFEKYGGKLDHLNTVNQFSKLRHPSGSDTFLDYPKQSKKKNFTPVKFKDFKV